MNVLARLCFILYLLILEAREILFQSEQAIRNCSDCSWQPPEQGEKCEFTSVNDHFSTQAWWLPGAI